MRLVSFNLLHGMSLSDGRVDRQRICSAVAALDADVLALQEVDRDQPRSGGLDLTALAADALRRRGHSLRTRADRHARLRLAGGGRRRARRRRRLRHRVGEPGAGRTLGDDPARRIPDAAARARPDAPAALPARGGRTEGGDRCGAGAGPSRPDGGEHAPVVRAGVEPGSAAAPQPGAPALPSTAGPARRPEPARAGHVRATRLADARPRLDVSGRRTAGAARPCAAGHPAEGPGRRRPPPSSRPTR